MKGPTGTPSHCSYSMLVIRHIAALRVAYRADFPYVGGKNLGVIARSSAVTVIERRYSAPAQVGERAWTPLPAALRALTVRFAANGAVHSRNSLRRCLIPDGATPSGCSAALAGSKPGLAIQSKSARDRSHGVVQ